MLKRYLSMNASTLELATGLLSGNRTSLSRSITLIESTNVEHEVQAEYLMDHVLKNRNQKKRAFRLGITGPPGAGKSTFIEALGSMVVKHLGYKLAVIAVDPSSSRTHGSILGDKTRMTKLSVEQNAFVRPSPTRGRLGGIAQHTNDVVLLTEAAGYDLVFVETVGLGQSEIAVDSCVDMLLLLVPPANGDELQGVKKGIMEVADLVVVNKADGNLADLARHAVVDYSHAIQLARPKYPQWRPRVKKCSSIGVDGEADLKGIWEIIEKFRTQMSDVITEKRDKQSISWMWTEFQEQLSKLARENERVNAHAKILEMRLANGQASPRVAAKELLTQFIQSNNSQKL